MNAELFRNFGAPDDPGPQRRRSSGLEELRRRAERQSQVAHDAIARVVGTANPEQQLNSLSNVGGQ
jgi:hypothetical protein